jgi:small-conductance mechanosensitive channel
MADKDFFEEEKVEEVQEPQKIKVGEKEYDQADLEKLVGLGEIGREMEEKWKTPIDRVYPEYTKSRQALSDRDRKIEELEAKTTQQVAQAPTGQLSEEQRKLALDQLENLGVGPKAIADMTRNIYREEAAARDLLDDTNRVVANASESGFPKTDPQALLNHMAETGIKNPQKAYNDMYAEELDRIKEEKLGSLRSSGMVTTSSSTAGSKQPSPNQTPKNRSDLAKAVLASLGGE